MSGFDPAKKLPKKDEEVLVRLSGWGNNVTYEHCFGFASFDKRSGWFLWYPNADEFEIERWWDLPPSDDEDEKGAEEWFRKNRELDERRRK